MLQFLFAACLKTVEEPEGGQTERHPVGRFTIRSDASMVSGAGTLAVEASVRGDAPVTPDGDSRHLPSDEIIAGPNSSSTSDDDNREDNAMISRENLMEAMGLEIASVGRFVVDVASKPVTLHTNTNITAQPEAEKAREFATPDAHAAVEHINSIELGERAQQASRFPEQDSAQPNTYHRRFSDTASDFVGLGVPKARFIRSEKLREEREQELDDLNTDDEQIHASDPLHRSFVVNESLLALMSRDNMTTPFATPHRSRSDRRQHWLESLLPSMDFLFRRRSAPPASLTVFNPRRRSTVPRRLVARRRRHIVRRRRRRRYNCRFKSWYGWKACPQKCGGGLQYNYRGKFGPYFGGAPCFGTVTLTKLCNTKPCPYPCRWTNWGSWSQCSLSCDRGESFRFRKQYGPFYGGGSCVGSTTQTKNNCNAHYCPAPCSWKPWGSWKPCTKTCGSGNMRRFRTSVGPLHGGSECQGSTSGETFCNVHMCPVDGVWGSWMMWSACTTSCDGGISTRNRMKQRREQFGGSPAIGESTESKHCNEQACPVDCMWREWEPWPVCSESCHGGKRKRKRTRKDSESGGKDCAGKDFETQTCGFRDCPKSGVCQAYGAGWPLLPALAFAILLPAMG